jgi:hypothetical protein
MLLARSWEGLQRMLGHATARMTLDVYGGLYDDELEDLADRIEARLSWQGTQGAQTGTDKVTHVSFSEQKPRST